MTMLEKLQAAYTAQNEQKDVTTHTEEELSDAKDVINFCLEEHRIVSFRWAAQNILGWRGGNYPRRYTKKLINLFQAVMPGADALLIGLNGKYGKSVEEQHIEWLASKGFDKIDILK